MDAKIQYQVGYATVPVDSPSPRIIAHVCNDRGGWGKGFVLAISKRWPEPESDYRRWFPLKREFGLGQVRLVPCQPELFVANRVAQRGLGKRRDGSPALCYSALENCLDRLGELASKHGASVHVPRIGCGLAGGKWKEIEPLIDKALIQAGIPTFVYDYV